MTTLKQTPLHALHCRLGAKMVPFAGYDMPVQYPLGVKKEHEDTRHQCGLFGCLAHGANSGLRRQRSAGS